MKISNSKQELARIISDNGGWRDGEFAAQDGYDTFAVWFFAAKPVRVRGAWVTNSDSCQREIDGVAKIPNWHQTVLSRAEYLHLYPAPDADGWIEWKGGECPVERGVIVDIKDADGYEWIGVKALDCTECHHDFWVHAQADSENNIIAYRLHKPEQAKPKFCESVMRSIPEYEIHSKNMDITQVDDIDVVEPKPTIEQLTANYRNAKDYAERKQEEADAAKADADARLAKLVAAGEALGLVLGVADAAPVATKFTGKFHSAKHGDRPSDLDMICDGCGRRFGHHVGFDCRP